jgi:hypothetical protein
MSKISRLRKMTCAVIGVCAVMLVSCGGGDTTSDRSRPAWRAYLEPSNDQGEAAAGRWLSREAKRGDYYPDPASGSGGVKPMIAMCMRWETEGRPAGNEEMSHADSGWCPGLLHAYYTGAGL